MEALLNLKFKGGVVTDLVDLKRTLGHLIYLGSEPILHFDEETQTSTGEIAGYEMVVISEQTKKPYKIKFNQAEINLSHLRPRDVVELIQPTVRFYHDGGALTQGSTISISAVDVRKVEKQGAEPVVKKQEKMNSKP